MYSTVGFNRNGNDANTCACVKLWLDVIWPIEARLKDFTRSFFLWGLLCFYYNVLSDMWGPTVVCCFLAHNISCPLSIPSQRRKANALRSWGVGNCALPFQYTSNGWNHVTVASHILNYCSCLVEDGRSHEIANSAFGWTGNVTFSLMVSPSCPFCYRSPLVCSMTHGLGMWQ